MFGERSKDNEWGCLVLDERSKKRGERKKQSEKGSKEKQHCSMGLDKILVQMEQHEGFSTTRHNDQHSTICFPPQTLIHKRGQRQDAAGGVCSARRHQMSVAERCVLSERNKQC